MAGNNGYTTRAAFKRRYWDLEAGGGKFRLQSINAREFMSVRTIEDRDEQNARLVCLSYVDGDGQRQYHPDEWQALLDDIDAPIFLAMLEDIQTHSLTLPEIEGLVKN